MSCCDESSPVLVQYLVVLAVYTQDLPWYQSSTQPGVDGKICYNSRKHTVVLCQNSFVVEFLSSEVERRECEQSAGLADDGDQALPQATSSTSGEGQEQSSGGRAGASVPTLIDLTNSGMNPGGWKKTKNMNISQKRQIYYKVITYKY